MRQKNERWIDTRWSEETRKTPYQSLFTSKSAEVLSAPVTRWVSIYGMRIYLVRSRKDVKEKSKKENKRGDDKPPVGRKREGWLGVRSSVISPGMMDGRALREPGWLGWEVAIYRFGNKHPEAQYIRPLIAVC